MPAGYPVGVSHPFDMSRVWNSSWILLIAIWDSPRRVRRPPGSGKSGRSLQRPRRPDHNGTASGRATTLLYSSHRYGRQVPWQQITSRTLANDAPEMAVLCRLSALPLLQELSILEAIRCADG